MFLRLFVITRTFFVEPGHCNTNAQYFQNVGTRQVVFLVEVQNITYILSYIVIVKTYENPLANRYAEHLNLVMFLFSLR